MPGQKSTQSRTYKKQMGFSRWVRVTHGKLLSVTLVFAFVGLSTFVFTQLPQSQAASGHHAQCTYINPSKTSVNPGEQFSARVTMYNDGSTTYSPDYAFYLADPNNTWNFKGNTVTKNIPPNYSVTFDLTLTAPTQPGNYSFSATMAIVFQGSFPNACAAKTITVLNTAPPSISLTPSSNQVTQGSALSLSWNTSNAVSCNASGQWSGAKAVSGAENRGGDTAATGTRTYTLTCNNSSNVANAVSTTVNVVAAAPAPVRSPQPAPPPAAAPTTSPQIQGPGTPSSDLPVDTEAPGVPENVRATLEEQYGTVAIMWDEPTDNIGVTKYQIERSINETDWLSLADNLTQPEYTDTSADFERQYFYRIRAFDAANNASPYGSTQITTGKFNANVTAREGGTIKSFDDMLSVAFPAEAVAEDSLCSIVSGDELPVLKDSYATALGPYKVTCKTAANVITNSFLKPLSVVLSARDEDDGLKITHNAVLKQEGWGVGELDQGGDRPSFSLEPGSNSFAFVGKKTSTPLIFKILLFLLVVGLIAAGVIGFLYLKYRKEQYAKYDDYIRKSRGF